MEHIFYFDGDQKKISWVIENSQEKNEQKRIHVEYFYDKVSTEQSKYIALHVGLFWGVGRFIIKNSDTVNVMLDLKSMFDRLVKNKTTNDMFIEKRMQFIDQLVTQRKLLLKFLMIDQKENKAKRLISFEN